MRWKVIVIVYFEIKYWMSYNRGVPFPLKCKKKFHWRISGRHSYFCKNALDKISWTDWCCTCNFLLQNHLKSVTGSPQNFRTFKWKCSWNQVIRNGSGQSAVIPFLGGWAYLQTITHQFPINTPCVTSADPRHYIVILLG